MNNFHFQDGGQTVSAVIRQPHQQSIPLQQFHIDYWHEFKFLTFSIYKCVTYDIDMHLCTQRTSKSWANYHSIKQAHSHSSYNTHGSVVLYRQLERVEQ